MSKFAKKQMASNNDTEQVSLTTLSKIINGIKSETKSRAGHAFVTQDVLKTVVSMEGYSTSDVAEMDRALQDVNVSLEGFLAGTELAGKVSQAQLDAATYGAALAADPAGQRTFSVERLSNRPAMEGVTYIDPQGAEMFYDTPFKAALEAYDERDNRHVTTYTTTYNMLASRQGPMAEMFFPMITVAPDQVGFETSIRLNYVLNEIKSSLDGGPSTWDRKNLIQGAINPDIFSSDQTRLIPVVRPENLARFIDPTLVAPHDVLVGADTVSTAPLKMAAKVGLIPISQTDALLKNGTVDYSDAVDTSLMLDNVYVKLTGTVGGSQKTEVFKIPTRKLPTAVFTHALQGVDRLMQLNFESDAFTFTANTLTVAGVASAILGAALGTNTVRVMIAANGKVNLQTSETQIWTRPTEVTLVRDASGIAIPTGSGAGATAVAAFATATVEGYDLFGHRVNSNQRQRGQLLDTIYYNQIYTVPLRAPMSIARPRGASEENDAADLAALITATHFKINNDAVKTLLEAADFLNSYVSNVDTYDTAPAILGVARNLVTPYYRAKTIDLTTVVQSLTSADRRKNIQEALNLVLRDYVFNAYRDSGWQPAADSLAGGDAGKPKVLIGCDPVIAGYLIVDGDNRLIGEGWEVEVQSTWNKNMKGKMVVSFGQSNNAGKHNPMHFGNMAYKSELALILPTHRLGQNSKELMVTPSYLHVVNLPIMLNFDVTGLTAVATGQVPVPMHSV